MRNEQKRFYSPQFSELSAISVRRLAWAIGKYARGSRFNGQAPAVYRGCFKSLFVLQRHNTLSGLYLLRSVIGTGTSRVIGGPVVSSSPALRRGYGGSMSTHYQVTLDFTFSGCRPVLVNLSLHSTQAACTSWPFNPPFSKISTHAHIFPTLEIAHSFIAHLFKVHPNTKASYPVLDGGQQDLFQEVSECI